MGETDSGARLFGNLGLGLFVAGALMPFVLGSYGAGGPAAGFAVVAMLLALLFGILGRRSAGGKVALIGAGAVLLLGVAAFLAYRPRATGERDAARRAVEEGLRGSARPRPPAPPAE